MTGVRSGHALHLVQRPLSRQNSQTAEANAQTQQQTQQQPRPAQMVQMAMPPGHPHTHVTFGQINIISDGGELDADQFQNVRTFSALIWHMLRHVAPLHTAAAARV